MTPGEARLMRWNTHDFVTMEATGVDGGAPTGGAFCTRCQMFAPPGLHFPVADCRPMADGGSDGGI